MPLLFDIVEIKVEVQHDRVGPGLTVLDGIVDDRRAQNGLSTARNSV